MFDASLAENTGSTMEMLAKFKQQLSNQVPEIVTLRNDKDANQLSYYDGSITGASADNIPDDVSVARSDASAMGNTLVTQYTKRSTGTLASNASRKTSRARRREERKRAQGKGVYLEEYLVNSLCRLVERVNHTGPDVTLLAEALLRRGMLERAMAVESAMADIVRMCEVSVLEVFGETPVEAESGAGSGEYRPSGGDAVLADGIDAVERVNKPKVEPFKGVQLIR